MTVYAVKTAQMLYSLPSIDTLRIGGEIYELCHSSLTGAFVRRTTPDSPQPSFRNFDSLADARQHLNDVARGPRWLAWTRANDNAKALR